MKLSPYLKITLACIVFAGIPIAIGTSLYLNSKTANINAYTPSDRTNIPSFKQSIIYPIENNPSNPVSNSTTSSQTDPNSKPAVAGAITNSIKTEPQTHQVCGGDLTKLFICLLNEYRAKNNLSKVTLDQSLTEVAIAHSEWMNSTGIFSHTGVNETKFYDRCANAGVTCRAENLADGILDAKKLLNSWQANPGHNKNLLGPYSKIGFGISGPYITLLFN